MHILLLPPRLTLYLADISLRIADEIVTFTLRLMRP